VDCPSCAGPNAVDARFCMSCGRPLAAAADREAVQARRTVTVVFGDLAGSTELGERLDPEVLREVMLRYYAVMRDCLERHGGTVEKFIGDAVMAVFGVPQVREDDVARGVRAAWDMQCAMEALNGELAAALDVRLRLRVGVNTGEVLYSREFGDGHALVSGDAVNVAARLQQHAPDGGILLGAVTRRAVSGTAGVEPVRPLLVKGKAQALEAWLLVDVDPEGRGREQGEASPFVGREAELRELRSAWDRCVTQRGCHLFTLLGEPGMGKSRLASQFLEEVRSLEEVRGPGAVTALTRCQPYDGGGALRALGDLLRGLLGEPVPGGGHGLPELDVLLAGQEGGPAAAALLRGVLDGSALAVEDTFWAMGVLLETLGARHPVVLLFDDLQWGQSTLFDLVDHLADWTMGVPVLLLCLARLDLLDLRPRWSSGTLSATSRVLGPLSADECARLVASCAEVTLHERSDTLERIARTAEGNPLFAEQLVAALTDGGPADELPPTIQALLEARLDRLPREEHQVLEHASVIGREFTAPGLEVLGGPVPTGTPAVPQMLHSLVRRRLIEPAGRRSGGVPAFRFVHLLARDVCYAGLPKRRRAALHETYADWLASQDGAHSGDHVIGRHLAEAYRNLMNLAALDRALPALGARAARHLLAAGQAALMRGECSWAVELLDQAVALPAEDRHGRLSAALRLAEALIATGEPERARELLAALVADVGRPAAEAGGEAGDGTADEACAEAELVLSAHARLHLAGLGDPGNALAATVAAARAALPVFSRAADHLGLARARLAVAHASQARCRYTSATLQFTAALRSADRSGAALEQATALGGLAVTLWLGPEPASTAVDRCRELLAGYGARRRAGRAALCCPLAVLLAMRGTEVAQARFLVSEADRIVRELGLTGPRAAIETFGGLVEILADEPQAAEERLRRACESSRRIGDPEAHATALSALAGILLDAGRTEEAARLVDGARDGAGLGSPLQRAEREAVVARLLVHAGHPAEALGRAAGAVHLALAGDSPVGRAQALLSQARVLLAAGRAPDRGPYADPTRATPGGEPGWGATAIAAEAGRLFAAKGHLAGTRWARAVELESEAGSR
jgi:class 3 adenylate cyclase/tetratricopeptide (TPR) repeat protein